MKALLSIILFIVYWFVIAIFIGVFASYIIGEETAINLGMILAIPLSLISTKKTIGKIFKNKSERKQEQIHKEQERKFLNSEIAKIEDKNQQPLPLKGEIILNNVEPFKEEDDKDNICPYCKIKLKKVPKKKTKCYNCQNYIYVRSSKLLVDSNLVTEIEAEATNIIQNIINNGLLSIDDFNRYINKTCPDRYNLRDKELVKCVLASLLNILYVKGKEYTTEDLIFETPEGVLYILYIEQLARILKEKELYLKFRKINLMRKLKSFMKLNVKYVEIWAVGDRFTCDVCKSYDGKIFPLYSVLTNPILPHKDCKSEKFCRCEYRAVYED